MAALLEALPFFHLLTPLPGMGVRTTAAVIVAIGDGSGFRTAGHLASYAAARGTGRRRPGLGAERAGRVAAARRKRRFIGWPPAWGWGGRCRRRAS
ncbi:transposase [Streptomyces mirabilis]